MTKFMPYGGEVLVLCPEARSVVQAPAGAWKMLFTVSSLPPAACRRLQAITLAAFLAVKMAVPIDFKMQKAIISTIYIEQDIHMMNND